MSLRYQITLRFFFISLLILLLSGSLAIWQARSAVQQEVDASLNLAQQLLQLSLPKLSYADIDESDWRDRFRTVEQTRHLNIRLKKHNGEIIKLLQSTALEHSTCIPPRWFINLVKTDYPKLEQTIITQDQKTLVLIMQAHPLDEITEVWHETVTFFLTICALVLFTFLAINLVFNKTVNAIGIIINHLQHVETRDYETMLPDFSTLEYDSIARAINHMTGVLHDTQHQNRALTQHSLQIQECRLRHISLVKM